MSEMAERERLIEIIRDSVNACDSYWASIIADGLIENGVVLPVRCVECIYHTVVKSRRFPNLVGCDVFGMCVSKDGFCYRGERRADNEETSR